MQFATELAEAGWDTNAVLQQGLDMRDLRWTVGIARHRKVAGVGVQLVPDEEPSRANEILATLHGGG